MTNTTKIKVTLPIKRVMLSFICLVLLFKVFGQTVNITIQDEKREPLIGATIHSTDGTMIGVTDIYGHYVHTYNADTVSIHYLGYQSFTQVINPSFKAHPTIQLEPAAFSLSQVTVTHSVKATNVVSDIDLNIKPVSSSQEILRTVPGLFIGQHSGGGKAEQLFLRGFDVDHGTDVSVAVDGMPINMVSHAHGQGYADLHFIIPETIEKIEFGKGPYYADKGDFTTAAYVNFNLKNRLDHSSIALEGGQFNSYRMAAFINLLNNDKTSSYLASEYNHSDGWFDSPQNFYRANFMGRLQTKLNAKHTLTLTASQFSSKWNASGQVPTRAVESHMIDRFGAIDNTEGGKTSRQNFIAKLESKIGNGFSLNQTAFVSHYDFDLFSNFTFYLNDPLNGDQIRQKENRYVSGYSSTLTHKKYYGDRSFSWKAGTGLRYDDILENQLSHTKDRDTTLKTYRFGNIHELNAFAFTDLSWDLGKFLINPSLRYDQFYFDYQDKLNEQNLHTLKGRWSPKLNLVYQAKASLQYYLKMGIGFHSNDARVVLENNTNHILPAATGADLGTIVKPTSNLIINAALWWLDLQQEFVYVGDEGVIEPSGRTRRIGTDLSIRYQPIDWLFCNFDINYAHGRNRDNDFNNKFIPLAPVVASMGTVTFKQNNWNLSASYRYLSDRPATEDNSIVAKSYFVNDLAASYQLKKINFHIRIENLFNTKWNETQFATLSRLKSEVNPVEEIHFTPGSPFFLKGGVTIIL